MFKTIGEEEIEARKKRAFIRKGELISLIVSALIMIFVYSFAEANGLAGFLNFEVLAEVVPAVCIGVLIVKVGLILTDSAISHISRVYKEFSLWLSGIATLLVSGLVFLFPFAFPGMTRYQGAEVSPKVRALMMLSKLLASFTLTLPFAIFTLMGLEEIGYSGLLMVLPVACASLIPLKPLPGRIIFSYKKSISIVALVLSMVLLTVFTLGMLTPVMYLGIGVASAALAAVAVIALNKTADAESPEELHHKHENSAAEKDSSTNSQ